MTKKKIVWAAGILAMLVATGATAWATTSDDGSTPTAGPAARSKTTSAPEPKTNAEGQTTATPGSTAAASASRPAAAAKGTVVAKIVRPGASHCTLLSAYRVVDGEPKLAGTFEDEDGRTISGRLPSGRYVFVARDDCDTDLAEVWVGGTSSNDARRFTVTAGATTRLGTITLVADPSLSLTFVSEADGTPVVGEPFDVLDSSGSIVWSWSTDEAGRIQTSSQPMDEGEKSLRAGTYRFRVAGNDFEKIDFTIDLRDDVARTFTLTPLG